MWRGPMGNRYSTALGCEMPYSRSERDRVAKERGVEFCSRAEFLADNHEAREAVEYHKEVQAGRTPDPWSPPDTSAFQTTPSWAKELIK